MKDPRDATRTRVIYWLYAAAVVHFVAGLALVCLGHTPVFESYHRDIELAFWPDSAPTAARALQVLWIELFGATLQVIAIWLFALVRIGHRYRHFEIWGWLLFGLLMWAPQDMLVSALAGVWIHIVVDAFAIVFIAPPLVWLYKADCALKGCMPTRMPSNTIESSEIL